MQTQSKTTNQATKQITKIQVLLKQTRLLSNDPVVIKKLH